MKMSEKGKNLLAEWEGFETKVYLDVKGLQTIGVGHLLSKSEITSGKIYIRGEAVKYSKGLTKAQVIALLAQDLERFEPTVNSNVTVSLNQNQFDALVSFSFNVGDSSFRNSTLLKKLNSGLYNEVPPQLMKWVYASGKKVRGLEIRRKHECDLWSGKI